MQRYSSMDPVCTGSDNDIAAVMDCLLGEGDGLTTITDSI